MIPLLEGNGSWISLVVKPSVIPIAVTSRGELALYFYDSQLSFPKRGNTITPNVLLTQNVVVISKA